MNFNQNISDHLQEYSTIFDSNFESGNLDCVVKIREDQYDLVLRIDSNTKGHILWYYFKVINNLPSKRNILFHIVNMRMNKTSYERGMKPYVKRQGKWAQQGQVTISEQKIRFGKDQYMFLDLQHQEPRFRRLSIQLSFQENQQVQIAYSIPYTYSNLIHHIKTIKENTPANISLQIDNQNESLSGLSIPLITLTQQNDIPKYALFMIGRQHPGESNSSYVVQGAINYLISQHEDISYLRKHTVFYVIPMINPDGVVMGNFRTSLYGKDLNRLFKSNAQLIPEVDFVRSTMKKIRSLHPNKTVLFMDIHGHSARKNSFCFGPGIADALSVTDIRVLPKIIAAQTDIFRYPSCSFRIDAAKRTTARAVFSKLASLSYTIQSSNWAYQSAIKKELIEFSSQKWQQMGKMLIHSTSVYLIAKLNRKKKNKNKGGKVTSKGEVQTRGQSMKMKLKTKNDGQPQSKVSMLRNASQRKFIRQEESLEKQLEAEQKNDSDKFSSAGMDSDSEGQDMEEQKFKMHVIAASHMRKQFQKAYYGQVYEQHCNLQDIRKKSAKDLHKFKESKCKVELIACLRKKQSSKNDLKSKLDVENKLLTLEAPAEQCKQKRQILSEKKEKIESSWEKDVSRWGRDSQPYFQETISQKKIPDKLKDMLVRKKIKQQPCLKHQIASIASYQLKEADQLNYQKIRQNIIQFKAQYPRNKSDRSSATKELNSIIQKKTKINKKEKEEKSIDAPETIPRMGTLNAKLHPLFSMNSRISPEKKDRKDKIQYKCFGLSVPTRQVKQTVGSSPVNWVQDAQLDKMNSRLPKVKMLNHEPIGERKIENKTQSKLLQRPVVSLSTFKPTDNYFA